MAGQPHLSLSLSRELWNELLAAALPISITGGDFELVETARSAIRQIGVRERVAGLLEDRQPPQALRRVTNRARREWAKRRPSLARRARELARVDGTYKIEIDNLGTQMRYGHQQVGADAFLKGTIEGTLFLMRENIELPFKLERRVGVSLTLGDIGYDKGTQTVTGQLQDLGVHVGDQVLLQLLGRLAEQLLEQQLPRVNPVPILKRRQVEELVGGLGESLRVKMGVEDLELEVNEDDMTLKVRFGFSHAQITQKETP
jgi:hypothetical protein